MGIKIDGTDLARQHEAILKKRLSQINRNRQPTVVSFCNQDDPPSVKYTFMKLQKAHSLGIDFIAEEFSADTPGDYLENLVKKYDSDEVDGILVQLPLPENLNPFKADLLNLISPQKDVDGLTGKGPFLPATVKAVISILDEEVKGWSDQKIAVVGSTGEVGGPLVEYLKKQGVKVIEVSSIVGDINVDLKEADIVISATGEENLIKPTMLKSGAVLIDVGLGDFDPSCFKKASKFTPILGGVGPMTVISLMENVVESYEKRMVK